ncbi:ribosomal protein S18-alanine N-acetyltransferase [Phenylobacterium sp.]|uniref:ribosomal protein S18-alanine N-acetyltransferase n=1 Tax=Phenylobacterium sp. TaxID=1871053 RepID=UPI0026000A89|nr:ribosomal protein S18-alanine N-acetyltransferase [Phenylobacterium sp.]
MKLVCASATDAPAMASAHAQAFDRPWDAATFKTFLAGPGAYAFVAAGEDPMGVVLCRAMGGEAEVLTLAVPPWARRQGIGVALMTAAMGAARAVGASVMFLEVDIDNVAAVGLYERLGFSRAGLRKAYYDRGANGRADALVMRLDLTSSAH